MPVDFDIGLTTHLIQQLHKPFQPGLIKAVYVWFQVPVTEKVVKGWSVLVVRGVEFLKPCLDIRNRWRVRGDRHSGSLRRIRWRRCTLEGIGMNAGGEGGQQVPPDIYRCPVGLNSQMAASTDPHGVRREDLPPYV